MRTETTLTPTSQLASQLAPQRADDLATYQERYTSQECRELDLAGLALDVAFILEHARRKYGRRWPVTIAFSDRQIDPEALERYLRELGYHVKVTPQVLPTGQYIDFVPRGSWWQRSLRSRRFADAG